MSTSILAREVMFAAQAFVQTTPVYSTSKDFSRCQGNTAILLITTASSTSSIAVTQQCSVDNVNWYDPVDALGVAIGGVVTAQAVTAGKYISYSPVMAPFIRFKSVETNAVTGTITLSLVFREEA